MSTGRDIHSDRAATAHLILNPAARSEFAGGEPNWLGHTGGASGIDWELLDGATMLQLLRHRTTKAAVDNHIVHLRKQHGLLVERGEAIRFSRSNLGLPIHLPSTIRSPLQPAAGEGDGPSATDLLRVARDVTNGGYFNPAILTDERERRLREVVMRRGQPDFRARLIGAYGGRCAMTGCDAIAALEAAHIAPYSGPDSQHVSNGLLLQADIHTLFDLDLIGIDPRTMAIAPAESLQGTTLAELDGQPLHLPQESIARPNREALASRWKRFQAP